MNASCVNPPGGVVDQSGKLTLYIDNLYNSTWSMRVWLCLKHIDVAFETVRVPIFQREGAVLLRAVSGAETVPVLLDGDLPVRDSLAIVEYLAEQHPSLWPAAQHQRAHARALCAEMHAGFEMIRTEMPMDCRRSPEAIALSEDCLKQIARVQACWSGCLANREGDSPWLFSQWSIADAFFAPMAMRFYGYAITLETQSKRYVDAQLASPFVREWVAAAEQCQPM